jgi:hypothetical protein
MAKTKEEKSLDAKRARAWTLYRITLEEQDAVENFQRSSQEYSVLLTKGDLKETALLFNDHDHVTGLYRGRLAYLINKGLGTIEGVYKARTPEILRALAFYLENPPAVCQIGPHYGMTGKAKINKKVKIYGSPTGPIKAPKKGKQ